MAPAAPQQDRDHGAELLEQTHIWRGRLRERLPDSHAMGKEGERMLTNIRSYDADSEHFEAIGDLVRAFECVLWAWAWLEIGWDLGQLRRPSDLV